eukprot:CAMPEP_0184663854 /NCGR_PEP_ID=MMETSP0308-20130426/50207_1 /TAXON_ID=38269 /ORGANISM="Gloeochaete witrockiana, Strain SAG 46.84" /LENGTH=125 /DNA_ID=CAMNT_0027106891 /DNA_START=215 /DNA_END=589 /DNA_ORIENTATION=-
MSDEDEVVQMIQVCSRILSSSIDSGIVYAELWVCQRDRPDDDFLAVLGQSLYLGKDTPPSENLRKLLDSAIRSPCRLGDQLPGKVFATGVLEWVADLRAVPLGTFVRAEMAVKAGLFSVIALPVW